MGGHVAMACSACARACSACARACSACARACARAWRKWRAWHARRRRSECRANARADARAVQVPMCAMHDDA
eukprot:4562102-Prymnesium_polylepis.1